MPILVDFSQIAVSNIMMYTSFNNFEMDENIIRHMILNSLRMYNKKFKQEYGEMILCCDGYDYWRKHIFPNYKKNRKKDRDESPIDWKNLFSVLEIVKEEIKMNMPYRVFSIPHVEADDIIFFLTKHYSELGEKVLILSGDKDFAQLQKYPNVYQFSPVQKKFIREDDPIRFLQEKIILGDPGDGVPNIMSDDDTFLVENKRQTPIRRTKIEEWLGSGIPLQDLFDENTEIGKKYIRNRLMIDLEMIPDSIKFLINQEFKKPFVPDRSKIFNYFVSKKLKRLKDYISEF
jgi:5'-3' exonuclease